MKKLMFVYNPVSGKADIGKNLSGIVEILSKDYIVNIHATTEKNDAYRYILDNLNDKYSLLVCSGGDGTLSETVSGLIDTGLDIPLGYIPSGSTNDYAKSIGICSNMYDAANAIVKGTTKSYDVGGFNKSYFVYVAAFGLFTDVSYKTDQDLKNILGHAAYIVSGIMNLDLNKAYSMKILSGDNLYEGNFIFGMITNSLSVGGIANITGKDTKLDDGFFEVTLVKQVNNINDLNDIIAYFLSGKKKCDAVIHFTSSKLEIFSDDEVCWTLDGEYGGNIPNVTIENLKNRIRFKK